MKKLLLVGIILLSCGIAEARLQRDDNGVVFQGEVDFSTQDATATPVTSPVSITTAVTELKVPSGAVTLLLRGSAAIRISEASDIARYFTAASGSALSLGVGEIAKKSGSVYVRTDTGSASLFFIFGTLGD